MFSPAETDRIVSALLPADAQPGEKVLIGTVDQTGAQVVAAFKFQPRANGFQWELQAAARHDWTGDNSVSGKIIMRWP